MIEFMNVDKKFDDNYVLKDINIKLKEGKIYGLVGRNGSGKTMLMNVICGFVKPDDGNVIVNGIDIYQTKSFP